MTLPLVVLVILNPFIVEPEDVVLLVKDHVQLSELQSSSNSSVVGMRQEEPQLT